MILRFLSKSNRYEINISSFLMDIVFEEVFFCAFLDEQSDSCPTERANDINSNEISLNRN